MDYIEGQVLTAHFAGHGMPNSGQGNMVVEDVAGRQVSLNMRFSPPNTGSETHSFVTAMLDAYFGRYPVRVEFDKTPTGLPEVTAISRA